jgi:type IV pilus assembly protein PilY1
MYARRHKADAFGPAAGASARRPASTHSTTEPRIMKRHSKTFLFFNFALAALIGLAAGTPLELRADDTEIYLGNKSLSAGVKPNVLFILDTSGSMNSKDGGSVDRLDRMKDAMNQILTDVNNINVGLMRFHTPGGPIMFPVSYIDEDVSVVTSGGGTGMDINVQVSESSDDAEELALDGSVDLVSDTLELIETTKGGSQTPVFRQVSSQANNAEETLSNGSVITANIINMDQNQTNGVRFDNITVPPGATITDARIVFKSTNGDSSNTNLRFYGEADVNSAVFPTSCSGCKAVSGRIKTAASVFWSPNNWSNNEQGADTTTPNLAAIVQEIVDMPGWASGNPLTFIQTNGGFGQRRADTYQGSASGAAMLSVTYTTASVTSLQTIGLRFQGVGIPQGATITNAVLEFQPTAASKVSDPEARLHIYGEASTNAAPFSATTNNITGRSKTTAMVTWDKIKDWDVNVNPVYQSADISTVVQEIVDDTNWCGNNAMAFIIEVSNKNGPQLAESWDNDPSRAPMLRVDFDEASAPNGCIEQWVQRQIPYGEDDAEETISSGSVSTGGSQLDMDSSQINGLRFRDVPIAQGAKIIEAHLVFTARSTDSGASMLRFSNQQIDDAPAFSNNNKDIADRTTGVSVDWDPGDWDNTDEQHTTVDISALIQDVIDRSGWKAGNSLAIIQEHVSGSRRRAYTMNGGGAVAPMLRIKMQGTLSSGGGGSGVKTVRQELKEIINGFDHSGSTPIVDTLYEAALYYRGEAVKWGANRGKGSDTVRKNTRVSHPQSYTGGTVVRDTKCTDANLNASECKDEYIDGSPIYKSPITEACQANYIVLLTDGSANNNNSASLIPTMTGNSVCEETDNDEECGRNLVRFLNTSDQGKGPTGDQYVTTYTIGFNFSGSWLKDLAIDGGGSFYTADSANALANVFKSIIADILSRTTSFATPSLSVNAFNKLFHRNDVYFSLFKPSGKARWDGNVKKYELCKSAALGCDLGEVLDANGDPAVNAANAIRDEALSFWSTGTDGAEIKVGGAGNEIPVHGSRRVYTYTSAAPPSGTGVLLSGAAHLLEDSNAAVTKDLLGDPSMSNGERTDLINWIRGLDVDDEDGDTNKTENRYGFNDPLHSSPVAVTYGGTDAAPVIKLFVGTNDGGIRMTNAQNGIEEWIFYPQETLGQQIKLRPNPNGDHFYGVDGTPTIWLNDEPKPSLGQGPDGVIDPNHDGNGDGTKEFVKLFVGMRRGGDKYYALDVTPPTGTGPLTDPTKVDQVAPTLSWIIDGGTSSFPRLGETWSQPRLASIALGTATAGQAVSKTVLIFAGGYDAAQDSGFASGGLGNAIYIVDPSDGSRLFWISGTDHVASDGVTVPGMDYPIPSDVSLMDSDGDGITDRLYVGDLGGNLWRIDLSADLTTGTGAKAIVGKLATVSDIADPLDQRKFFYKPDVVQAYESNFSSVGRYDIVTINTGDRAHPLDESVQDRFYAFRDYHVSALVDDGLETGATAGDGLADGYGKCDSPTPPTLPTCRPLQGETQAIPTGDLFDVTNVNDPTGADLTALKDADGYFLDFEGKGEKGLASPVVLGGTAFFTSYLPDGVVTATTCSLAEGSGLLYAINVLNGAAVYPNWDDVGDDTNLTKADRTYTLGGGIPSSAVPIFQEEGITLLIGGGGGATTIDPNLALPRSRTYWGQEE